MDDRLDFLTGVADEDRRGIEYRLQMLVLAISDRVHERLRQMGIPRAELARRMGVSRPMVTKLLAGDSNFQLRTLLRMADALDMDLVVGLVPEGFRLPRFYVSREPETFEAYEKTGVSEGDTPVPSEVGKRLIELDLEVRDPSTYTVQSFTRAAS
ncbi:MAG: helix-turn-helix transcriptional regulator [Coriobacteriia bacterium]|nr:helix-turn-helix transcriptional regulator [Coriobacteriia bacterium]